MSVCVQEFVFAAPSFIILKVNSARIITEFKLIIGLG
jgi:hypothetical protein